MVTPETELIVTHGGTEILRRTLTPGEFIIGRETSCDIVLEVDGVSRNHAKLTINYDYALIEDLGSSNGTFVNGQRVGGALRLWPNQKIKLGGALIEVRRVKPGASDHDSLTPAAAVVKRVLPEEFLREKKYEIGRVVAQGGMGAILDAREATTRRSVAMKVMLDTGSADALMRFISEATITAQLEHPNIVPVHELSVDENDQVFYTMKFVRGVNLCQVLEQLAAGDKETVAKYTLPHLLTVIQKVCDAMAFAHSKMVIHRDLKPENVMMGDFGEVLVMDWGLAKVIGEPASPASATLMRSRVMHASNPAAAGATMAGAIMGTPQFMAPEQARGDIDQLDARSDIYGLGAILYNMLTLRAPLEGTDPWEVVRRVGAGKIDPLTAPKAKAGNPQTRIPESLAAVVQKAMALHRFARYQSVPELQRDIDAYQTGFATNAEKAGAWKQLTLFIRRNKAAAIGAAAVVLIGSTVGTQAVIEGRRAKLALEELSGTAPTFAAQAGSLIEAQKFEEALEKIGFAIRLDGGSTEYHRFRANTLQALSRLGEAGEEYRRVLALKKDDSSAAANLTLSEKLLEENGGKSVLSMSLKFKLLDALLAQNRPVDAVPLSHELKRDSDTAVTLIKSRLKAVMAQANWTPQKLTRLADGTFHLDLREQKVPDLGILADLPISSLDISGFSGVDLTLLRTLPLKRLKLANAKELKFEGLRGMKLQYLDLSSAQLNDLSALAGMALEELNIYGTQVSDLSPLRGMPLKTLNVAVTQVRSVVALRGAPLNTLDISQIALENMDGLQGAPLRKLTADRGKLTDISALRGSTVAELNIASNPLTDLSPLVSCPNLERLMVPVSASDIGFLKKLPNLKVLGNVPANWANVPTAEAFWKKNGDRLARQVPMEKKLGKFRQSLIAQGNDPDKIPNWAFTAEGELVMDLRKEIKVSDISELHGVAITKFVSNNSGVRDLSALAGAPLRELILNAPCSVSELSPLSASKLESLFVEGVPVRDISVLRKMPLRSVYCRGCPITDVSPLADIPTLEVVGLPAEAKNVETLRKHPKIALISYDWNFQFQRPTRTAAEFWADYDAKKAAGK